MTARAALLIDDSRLDQLNTRRLLVGIDAGFARVEWLDHWPGAERALADGPFDLFLVDIHLGAASGLDVIRDLRAAGVLAPIIALTGSVDEEIDRAATEAGASDFLQKDGLDRAGLERAIRYAGRQADVHRELDRLNAALERRAAAESDQARLMRFAIEQSSDAIFITKAGATLADHALVYVNAALCRLLERRAGDLLGSDVAALCDDGARPGGELPRAVAAHGAFFGTVPLRGAAAPVVAKLRATPLRSTDSVVTHYVWSARDADEDGDGASSALARGRLRLETIGRITAGVAHELNDRLTTVIGNLELLAARAAAAPCDDAARGPTAAALRAADALALQSRLIVDLAGRVDDEAGTVDVDALLDALAPLLRHAVGKLVGVARRPAPEAAWRAAASAARLELALLHVAAMVRTTMADGAVLEVATRNVPADAAALVAAASPTLDRHRDHVALSLSDVEPLGDRAASVRGERARAEELVADAGGTLVVERPTRGALTATIYLPRAPQG